MNGLKQLLRRAASAPAVSAALAPLMAGRATIFMLHRFHDSERGSEGHDRSRLREALAFLRRERYNLIELGELFHRLRTGGPGLRRAVAFTLDDGYADQVEVAGPVFAEFDCPATIFVTTGFLDGALWFWWDQIEYLFDRAVPGRFAIQLGDTRLSLSCEEPAGRAWARVQLTDACKRVPDAEKHAAIERLAAAAGVDLPTTPPKKYAAMSWDQLRAWESRGLTFGPHTVTHPILAQAGDEQSEREIAQSWHRLQAEARRPVPVFCYPNGQPGDFGPREYSILRGLGLDGAVVGSPGFAERRRFGASADARFQVPRYSCPDDLPTLVQCVNGIERLKHLVGRDA